MVWLIQTLIGECERDLTTPAKSSLLIWGGGTDQVLRTVYAQLPEIVTVYQRTFIGNVQSVPKSREAECTYSPPEDSEAEGEYV